MSDPRIDAYIAKAQPFAQPVLTYLRAVFHEAVPELEETIKWGIPHFVHAGKNLGGMAGFKAHVSLLISGAQQEGEGMGGYGKLAGLDQLPPKKDLLAQIRQAAKDIGKGKKPAWSKKSPPKDAITMPQDFAAALRDAPEALAVFDSFPPSQQREYLVWITGAKQEKTRVTRLATTIEWLAEGKRRNWKYEN